METEPDADIHYFANVDPAKVKAETLDIDIAKVLAEGGPEAKVLEELLAGVLPKRSQPVKNLIKPRVSKLSSEEQNARRVLKRHKRQRAAERRTAAQRGQSVGRQRAKASRKERRTSGASQDN